MILYFSGCGNSQFVATELARITGQGLRRIDPLEETPELELSEGEMLGVVCPVYAWSVPRLVDDYISRLQCGVKPGYLFLAVTCGDNVGHTPERFARTLARRGWQLDSAFSFVMPETYINLPGFKLDTVENVGRKVAAARERLPKVAERIMNREKVIDVVRGSAPWLTSGLLNPLFYGLLITDKKFRVTDGCISCGKCVEVCPLSNITLKEGKPQWHGSCTNCMACYHHCPKNAIHFGKATLNKGQYFFN